MQTRCPECHTLFRVTEDELNIATGKVRCGHCYYVFDAVIEEEPTSASTDDIETNDIDINTFIDGMETEQDTEDKVIRSESKHTKHILLDHDAAIDDLIPPELRSGSSRNLKHYSALGTTLWTVVILLMFSVTVSQLVYFNRAKLATYPELRPHLEKMCELAQCDLPELRDINRIELSSRNVYSHPNVDQSLMITAIIVNQAPFAQRFPEMQVSFTNLVGDTVAARRFKPDEYLNTSNETLGDMQPGLPVAITLEVIDPGKTASAYEFDFF